MRHHAFNYLTDGILLAAIGGLSLSQINLLFQVGGSVLIFIAAAVRLYKDLKNKRK